MIWQEKDFRMFCAVLPSSLLSLDMRGGRVSLPDLGHLTALTKLRLDGTVLTPARGQLPPLPALQVVKLDAVYLGQDDVQNEWSGPQDLGLASSAPSLIEASFNIGKAGMSRPHEQLATLAPLAHLKTIVLDFDDYFVNIFPEHLLEPDALLSLPHSVTELVLWDFDRCVPFVAVPENVATVYKNRDRLTPNYTLINAA